MHLVYGCPAVYSWDPQPKECDGRSLAVLSSSVGNYIVVLSSTQLHFWTGTSDIIYLGSVRINGATVDDDPATHFLLHARGNYLVVTTLQRRILFFNISLEVKNTEVLAPLYHDNLLRTGSFVSRVRFLKEERLEFGIVTSLASGGSNCFFVCTTAGVVCVMGWFQQKLLHTWSCRSLCKDALSFVPPDEMGEVHADSSRRVSRGDILSGSILDVSHSSQLKLTVLLLSNGYVILAQSNVGSDFTRDDITFSLKCAAATCVARVSMNSRHMLLVLATDAGDIMCKWIGEDLTLKPMWNGLKCLKGVKRHGSIGELLWSPDEELLCVGFYHLGVFVLHYSGVCLYSSMLFHNPQRRVVQGCVSFSWASHGHRLFVVEPLSDGFTEYRFSQIISSPCGETTGCFTPIVAFNNDALRLAGHFPAGGGLTFNDVVSASSQYAIENYPLTQGAVSPDGGSVVLTGKKGFVLFDCLSHRWSSLREKKQEAEFVCVAQPLWLSNIAVVMPVRMNCSHNFELRVYARRYLDENALLFREPLERMPLQVCECHEEYNDMFILLLDSSNALLLWRCVIAPGRHSYLPDVKIYLEFIKRTQLPDGILYPVGMAGIHPARKGAKRTSFRSFSNQRSGYENLLPYALFILRGSHALVSFDLGATGTNTSETPSPIKILSSDGVCRMWIDYSVPMDGGVVIVFGVHGINLLHLLGAEDDTEIFPVVHEYGVSEFDAESIPVGLSTYNGCLFTAFSTREIIGSIGGGASSTVSLRISLKPVLYNFRVLTALTCMGLSSLDAINKKTPSNVNPFPLVMWNDRLLYWLEGMRRNGTFIPNADYFLHTLISESIPCNLDHDSRRAAVQATVSLLRRYSEFYSVLVSCMRTLDVSQRRTLLDVLGSPLEFFRECIENCRFEESAQLLRVIMLDGNFSDDGASVASLESTMLCAVHLFVLVLWRRNVPLVHDLLRFMALLHTELLLPNLETEFKANTSGVWKRFLNTVGFQKDPPQEFSLETEPLCLLTPEEVSGGSSNTDTLQRRSAVEFVLRKYPNVRQAVHDVVSESLFAGHLMVLRDISHELFISLRHFVTNKTQSTMRKPPTKVSGDVVTEDDGCEETPEIMHLPALFDGIHDEFGLPRSLCCIGTEFQDSVIPFMATEGTESNMAVWTTAQSYVYTTPRMVETILGIRDLYSIWDECVLAVNIVLMIEDAVVQQIQTTPMFVQALKHLIAQPQNAGYTTFVQGCINGYDTGNLSTGSVPSAV
ncbi:hypothetical protein MOQ_002969 [Trypanosoma cruzi marinkellei]|uniref:RIC1 C-terminal alpha solenoid region domain-containing protein n=1 Tax=Trypanosoma cruzi marinkellei TaxID=85056 RepID=K2MDC0_TRYCR|nr:hypothetical protein MOQ_002969 [Trypanosoma cruzi marinkellei]